MINNNVYLRFQIFNDEESVMDVPKMQINLNQIQRIDKRMVINY